MIDNNDFDEENEYPKYGYNVDGLEKIEQRFKCIFCSRIMKDPIQLIACGHRSCYMCFEFQASRVPDENVTCPCADCHVVTHKDQIMRDTAHKKELDDTFVDCIHQKEEQCSWIGKLKDYQVHLDQNHIDYICSECNERFSSQKNLNDHIPKTHPALFELCSLAPLCSDEMIRKTEISKHSLSEQHQETISKLLSGEYRLPTSTNPEQANEANEKRLKKLSEELYNPSKEVQEFNNVPIQLNETYTNINDQLNKTIKDLNNCNAIMNEKLLIKQSLQPSQEKIQKDIEQIQQLCDEHQHISMDGTLTWRVDHVSEKMADAQSERQTSIYSPIFYSSPTGYKMRARLFLFGDGNARRTHISLFVLLMKGEYDAILKWPFHYKKTFCLLDQTGGNHHIIDSFRPDIRSNSFQRPKTEANIASGIPKFVPLSMLLQNDNAYVREDTLYIKIIIEFNDTPRMMLPYMLSLNPALPNYVQQKLIEQEKIKRQQQSSNVINSQTT